jgi:hypothetical protein
LKKVRKQDDLYKTNLFEKFSNSNFWKFISLVQWNENIKTIEDLKNLKEMEDEEVSSCMTLYYNVRFWIWNEEQTIQTEDQKGLEKIK